MTKNEFNSLCSMLYIDPELALENDKVVQALIDGWYYDEIAELLEAEF